MKVCFQDKFNAYLETTLGLTAEFIPHLKAANWPLHLTESYEINECTMLGKKFLALIAHDRELTPAAIEKHAEWIHQKTDLQSIFVLHSLAAYNRKRLIERKIPFVVPARQLYLPDLGLDLREHVKQSKPVVTKLAPASQVLVLAHLLRRINLGSDLTAATLAQRFGYTKMTMSRALDELRALHLVGRNEEGPYGRFQFILSGRELWERARSHLRSPVKKRIYLDEWFPSSDFQAGAHALSGMTMLGHTRRAVWAVTGKEWKQLQKSPDIRIIPEVSREMAHAEFEIWHYDPRLLAEKPCVDPLSLVLSLGSETADERVSMAIDILMRRVSW